MRIGSFYNSDNSLEFCVWAPLQEKMVLKAIFPSGEQRVPMQKDSQGYWRAVLEGAGDGLRYQYELANSLLRPDPASSFQPDGVHGPSEAVDHSRFTWSDVNWKNVSLEQMVIYELHVGTFTREGTFQGVISRLDELLDLGINAIELMPVAAFPGERNWGYDGTYLFSVQASYGGPQGLKELVSACHNKAIAVILDVVYNHLGPEGNYLAEFAPYFTDKYCTAWGKAINFDGAHSRQVRNFFVENALYWFEHYHIDALRLDAVHGIFDKSKQHILAEISQATRQLSRRLGKEHYLIAESDLNDSRVIRPASQGGYGIDAQWCDDFHHALHALLTGERSGYYVDFRDISQLEKSYRKSFVYDGIYSKFRKGRHGNSAADLPAGKFIVFSQNHDQVGNRVFGERLSQLVNFEALKVAAAAVFVSGYIPLIFMGEEYAEESPFYYFVSHSDQELIKAVCAGRKNEFKSFTRGKELVDPQDPGTFLASKLKWERRFQGKHAALLRFYRRMIELKKQMPALAVSERRNLKTEIFKKQKCLILTRGYAENRIIALFNLSAKQANIPVDPQGEAWRRVIDSAEEKWLGPGSISPLAVDAAQKISLKPFSFIMYSL
ncbi:MAG: malto-oligosyltrehalose trehalohydrolase [Candidatus Omnitrophica bacterium]|jgi:maltooligosyltrehalose trehalohydrolase|nr:malto-oligosyltrehalose trehalohydrolase [Candidatus Omnitrophota bacterium]